MRHPLASTWICLITVLLLGAGSASALTICISPCPPIVEPTPPTPVDPLDLPDLSTIEISGLVLGAGDAGGPYNITGDLVVHVPSGILVADEVDLRSAGGNIEILVSINVAGIFSACTIGCEPFATEIPEFAANPFHLSILGPLTGALNLFASGNILVTSEPVPEPSAALLLGLGLSLLVATQRPTRSSRTEPWRIDPRSYIGGRRSHQGLASSSCPASRSKLASSP